MTELKRDRVANPSINFPETEGEAYRALTLAMTKVINDGGHGYSPLAKSFTEDAGLGQRRTAEQARDILSRMELGRRG